MTGAGASPSRRQARGRSWLGRVLLVVTTALALFLTATRLHISTDLSLLFPVERESAALGRFTRVFGGGDGSVILVRAPVADEARASARAMADALRAKPSVGGILAQAPRLALADPTLAWLHAGPAAREALARALTPEGMRARLSETRALLLAPGAVEIEPWLARDPLRLAMVPWESRRELAAGVVAGPDGSFEADAGRAQLLVVQPNGSAFDSEATARFMGDFEEASRAVRASHPTATVEVTGGHAIAYATEAMFKRDLGLSSALSIVFASLVFVATFRRARALVAVLPPLVAGTLWTTGLAALLPRGLSGVAVAFTAVVVGVGVDTGVHVYAALLEGRRRGLGPAEAARFARRSTWRPTLLAAAAAGLAFASLALSGLVALQQLGVLCGVGELLTSVAILWMTPEIGALLERGAPPPARPSAWTSRLVALTGTRRRAGGVIVAAVAVVIVLALGAWPRTGDAVVALRPRGLAPLASQETIYALFGGRPGQWIVLAEDDSEARAEARADAVAEALEPLVADGTLDGMDALGGYAPAPSTESARLRERDRLDLPGRRRDLLAALVDAGFDPSACAPALEAFASPTPWTPGVASRPAAVDWLASRHLRHDGDRVMAVTYVRPTGVPEKDARALAAIARADAGTVVTGYPYLEVALRESLAHDLPRVTLVACVVVAIALRGMLGRMIDVVLAFSTIAVEIAAVAVLMRVCHVHWHVYDALVLPVLVGVTIDESMFLLHAARQREREGMTGDAIISGALAEQGPLVVATALTTAAGFAALLVCRYGGLFDIGAVGSLGVLLGLVAALAIVPAGLRLAANGSRDGGGAARGAS
jgi:predicted RND superfamily exporter protein